MKKSNLLLLILFTHLTTFGQDTLQTTFTLESCIALALKNNAEVQRRGTAKQGNKINLNEARAALLPTVGGGVDHTLRTGLVLNPITNTNERQDFYSGNPYLSSRMVLFSGLNLLRTIRQQAFAYKASQMDEQQAKDNTTMDVVLAYLQVITAQDALEMYKQVRDVTYQQVQRLEILQNDGATPPGDYYDMKGQYAGDQVTVTEAENTFQNNKITLVNLLNIPYSEDLVFEPIEQSPEQTTDSLNAQTLYANAAASLGIIKASQLWKESAVMGVKSARSLYLPTLSVGGNINSAFASTGPMHYFDQIQNNLGRAVGLTLNVPILEGFFRRQQVARAKIDLQNAEIELENNKNNLQQETSQVLINLNTAKQKYIDLREQVAAYKESFRVAEVRFEAGDINSVEFLVQKNKHDIALINLIVAQYEWQMRHRIADYYNGKR